MNALNPEQREQVRRIARDVLYEHHPAALTRKKIQNRVNMETDFEVSLAEVVSALEYLCAAKIAEKQTDDLGSTDYWRILPSGIQAKERELNRPHRD